ncbi:MAG: serine hydrolase domain-containing protein [Acinetobacter sp.]
MEVKEIVLYKLLKKPSIGDIAFVIALVVIIGLITHFILISSLGFWRIVYPVQAQFAIWNTQCSNNAPVWMRQSLKYIIKNQKTLSNQLVYIDQNNQNYTCQSGWDKTTFFSKAVSKNTRFRYASMTKIVTSDAIISLINQDRLKINDRMIDFFSELKDQKFNDERVKNITLADLLQQRSGFDRMQSEDVMFATNKTPWCPSQLNNLLNTQLDFEPNTRYAYDNRNTCLLGAVLERVAGKSYRDYITQQYDLKKKNIKFIDKEYYMDEVRYDFRNSDFWMEGYSEKFDFQALSSSAGLTGSAKSLAKLVHEMLKQQPLNILDITHDNLEACKTTEFKSCNGYAMWQYQKDKNSPKMYFRNGGLPAATSLAMVTDQKEVIVWVSNGGTLYDDNFDENLLEKHFYQVFNP